MIITITAPTGGHKTRTALEIGAALGLNNNQKVIYFTKDKDYMGWLPHIESIVGKEKLSYFRPVYVSTLKDAMHILPHVDHLPYDFIIWDGFGDELVKLPPKILQEMEAYTTNKSGKIIILFQQNSTLNYQE